ncbi:MAG: GyrI-like domain-containing protein [Maricaulaceae bacterium]|jgi:AraC family transcriptional regulator
MSLAPIRFEDRPPTLLAGLRRTHAAATSPETVAAQWRDFSAEDSAPGAMGEMRYGAMCATDLERKTFDYLCAAEVSSFDGLPDAFGRMSLPAARYAVFAHEGDFAGLRETWGAIWTKWLPTSGFSPNETPDFERYDDRFDFAGGEGAVEIWFPVKS